MSLSLVRRPGSPEHGLMATDRNVVEWGDEPVVGWRGQFAYPARLGLVCSMCAWFEPGPGVPTVVHAFAGSFYALCDIHRGGIQLQDGRRTRPTDLDPRALQARLLDAYAVDLVPIDSVRSLFRRRRTSEPPAYVPSIRVVPPVDDVV